MKTIMFALAATTLATAPAFATDNIYVRPKSLSAGQFTSNCGMQGGTPVNISDGSTSTTTIDCRKKDGTSVTCSFDAQDGTLCVGESRTPRRPG